VIILVLTHESGGSRFLQDTDNHLQDCMVLKPKWLWPEFQNSVGHSQVTLQKWSFIFTSMLNWKFSSEWKEINLCRVWAKRLTIWRVWKLYWRVNFRGVLTKTNIVNVEMFNYVFLRATMVVSFCPISATFLCANRYYSSPHYCGHLDS